MNATGMEGGFADWVLHKRTLRVLATLCATSVSCLLPY